MKINLATAEGQQAWLDHHNRGRQGGYRLPEGAGPADLWLAILNDPQAPQACRMTAAKELRFLGPFAQRQAQQRADEAWFASLPPEEQREILRND